MKVVIMAGGKGTRIAQINSEVPKPMIPINDKPILEYQIEYFKRNNLTDIVLVVGHLKEKIIDYFGDGSKYGVNISYICENQPLGTAGSFYYLQDIIGENEDFILVNGDIIFDIDMNKMISEHKKKNSAITLCVHPNSHPYDSALIVKDETGKVIKWLNKEEPRTYYENCVNAGIHIINGSVLRTVKEPKKTDMDRDIIKPMISSGKIYAYPTTEYIKDMGTPERYYAVKADIDSGLVFNKNLSNKQKAFFIDRDGTINKYVGFLRDINDFELIDGVSDGIKKINDSGYLAIVVTNQPVIARGEVTFDELEEIHKKMETLLGEKGAYLDGIYFCPHHPDSGFEGEVKELKINCNCRKPNTGLVMKACEDFNIELSESFVVGDSDNDEKLAYNLGIPFLEVNEKRNINDVVEEVLKNGYTRRITR